MTSSNTQWVLVPRSFFDHPAQDGLDVADLYEDFKTSNAAPTPPDVVKAARSLVKIWDRLESAESDPEGRLTHLAISARATLRSALKSMEAT